MKLHAALFLLGTVIQTQGQSLDAKHSYPVFPVGPTGIRATIEKGVEVTVRSVDPGTPAVLSGLEPGDVLTSAGGKPLAVADPRVTLGESITWAEAEDGVLVLEFNRGGKAGQATVKLRPLGAYRASWPAQCPKSRAIIDAAAATTAKGQQEDGTYQWGDERVGAMDLRAALTSLFLLSTDNPAYLPQVARHARSVATAAESRKNAGGHVNWQLGYQGIFLGEYYLKTGDRQVLKGLKEICDWEVENQAAGGWGHGANVGPGYTQSGLMNHTTVPIVAGMILARECGVEFDQAAYLRALKLLYRMVGHGCICYGDHRSELWWSNTNGRNAMTACAFSLLGDPRFQQAARHLATLVTDSYFQPEFGHTGGGFNVVWRGIASVLVPPSRQVDYQRQMKSLAWYYDLARGPDGGFTLLATPPDNTRYYGRGWGAAIGLTYTAPLRTLRITGAPPGKFSVKTPPLRDLGWGTPADLVFFSTENAEGFGEETDPPDVVYNKLLGKDKAQATVEYCGKHLRHFSPLVRSWAARRLKEMNDRTAWQALAVAAKHADPRVRRAAYDGVSGYDNWGRPFKSGIDPAEISAEFLPAILKTLKDPSSAWWEVDGALFALGRAKPQDIRGHLPLILKFAAHEEWYLREGAFWAIVGLHETITGKEFNLLAEMYANSRHVFERSSYDAGFKEIVKGDKVALDRASMRQAIASLGKTTHEPKVMLGYGTGGIHEAAHRTMMILNHFDPGVYQDMVGDFVAYIDNWEPYYQHSVWLITGSKWQPGILKVLEGLGDSGKPVVVALKRLLARYGAFDRNRMGKEGGDLEARIRDAIAAWEAKNGSAR